VQTTFQSLKELQSSTQSGIDKIRQLEKDIERLASTLVGNGTTKPQVVELMTKRDTYKTAAEKYSTVMDITIVSSLMGSDQMQPETNNGPSLDDEKLRHSLIASLMGDEFETVNSNRIKFESLKKQLAKANSSTFVQRDILTTERDACKEKRRCVSDRVQELKLEIQKLDQEDEMIKNRIAKIDGHIASLVRSQSSEICELENELRESSKVIKLEDTAKSLVARLHVFESSIVRAASSTYSKENSSTVFFSPDQVARKMGIFVVRMMNYFNSEAEMVNFLRDRVGILDAKISSLQFEIEEFASLEMITNVAQMSKTLNETRQNIIDDNALIFALQGEARKMRDDLMKLLNNFKNGCCNSGDSAAILSLHASVLNGIKDALFKIGLDNNGGLTEYFDAISSNSSHNNGTVSKDIKDDRTQKHKIANNTNITTQPLKANGKTNHSGKVVAPDTIPAPPPVSLGSSTAKVSDSFTAQIPKIKMGWAVKSAPPQGTTRSFLDIQKEELQLKDVN